MILPPTAVYSAVTSVYRSSLAIAAIDSADSKRCNGSPPRRTSLAIASLPASRASSRRSLANHWRILALARGDTTKVCQSFDGPAVGALEVNTSTTSPFSSLRSSATSRPLTRAPIQR